MSRNFELIRTHDVSGTGSVAEGTVFTDGSVALRWKGDHPSTAVWPSLDEVLAVHGHDGSTTVAWLDGDSAGDYVAKIVEGIRLGERIAGLHRSRDDVLELHSGGDAEGFRSWLVRLGGNIAEAVGAAREGATTYPWEWSWTSPDKSVRVFYLTLDPLSLRKLGAVSHADAE